MTVRTQASPTDSRVFFPDCNTVCRNIHLILTERYKSQSPDNPENTFSSDHQISSEIFKSLLNEVQLFSIAIYSPHWHLICFLLICYFNFSSSVQAYSVNNSPKNYNISVERCTYCCPDVNICVWNKETDTKNDISCGTTFGKAWTTPVSCIQTMPLMQETYLPIQADFKRVKTKLPIQADFRWVKAKLPIHVDIKRVKKKLPTEADFKWVKTPSVYGWIQSTGEQLACQP